MQVKLAAAAAMSNTTLDFYSVHVYARVYKRRRLELM